MLLRLPVLKLPRLCPAGGPSAGKLGGICQELGAPLAAWNFVGLKQGSLDDPGCPRVRCHWELATISSKDIGGSSETGGSSSGGSQASKWLVGRGFLIGSLGVADLAKNFCAERLGFGAWLALVLRPL